MNRYLKKYAQHLRLAGIRTDPRLLVLSGTLVIIVSILLSVIVGDILPFLIGLVVADIIVFYPYYKGVQVLSSIDENISDALKQIASTLQSGGTFEMAVREVVSSDYGPLSKQFRYVLDDLQSGNTIDVALGRFASRVPSELVQRVVTIIVDAFHAGGGLAKVLEDVAEDARQTYRLMEERKAKTTMQSMFLVVSSTFLSPFIVGAAFGIMRFFSTMGKAFAGTSVISPEQLADSMRALGIVQTFLTFYVLFQAALSAIMLTVIREGRASSGVRYAPIFMLVAYLVLKGTAALVASMLGG
ncbi:MAG: hypothetical protein PWP76_745 [Candidatus Diapherotrites archaeon]|nr:hypothetical protein [Candidatus Diapherotrites archaeon]MDN5367277.1 hypothetical protein [Candidatus Diapherotrites archaeon]